jgi:hypothetical protein
MPKPIAMTKLTAISTHTSRGSRGVLAGSEPDQALAILSTAKGNGRG